MRTRVRSAAFIAAIVVALGMSVVTPTYADGTGVECPFNRCAVGATDPGTPAARVILVAIRPGARGPRVRVVTSFRVMGTRMRTRVSGV